MRQIILNKWRLSARNRAPLGGLMLLIIGCASPDENGAEKLMGSGHGIHSITLLTRNLAATRDYYNDTLGFDVPKPEKFDTVYQAALATTIDFADYSMLELLSLPDTATIQSQYAFIQSFLQQYEGARSYALSVSAADTTHAWLTSQGFETDSVCTYRTSTKPPKGWDWDDGGPELHSVDFDSLQPPAHLPQFTQFIDFDYQEMQQEWTTWYVYGRSYRKHPNGVVGIAAIKVAVPDLAASRKELRRMGFEELDPTPADHTVRFKLKRNQELHLVTSQSPDDKISQFLAARGSGVYAITFEVDYLDSTKAFLKERLPDEALVVDSISAQLIVQQAYGRGVQFEFVQEAEAQSTFVSQLMIGKVLDSTATKHAAGLYSKYCALCHGDEREGYAADNAPSLRSHSLLASSKSSNFLRYTIQYGRANTAMAGYLSAQGGPLGYIEIELILQWLYEQSGVEESIEISREPVEGNIAQGSIIYTEHCASCHGTDGEGITAPALGNPMLLATATDGFLQYAIQEGRDSTRMPAFKDSLAAKEINDVTAFLRSRASGWDKPAGDSITLPEPKDYILNPTNKVPDFTLRNNRFVSAKQVYEALQDSARLVLLDARSKVAWRQLHIPGAVPVPYYEEPDQFVQHMPNDSTWIVVYCACPHAASGRVVNTLKRHGFTKTAILDEGILVWSQLGYPVRSGY